ncbi:MAG: hypothetical protein ACMXX9_04545 [Candidatus Woesearchaeota archaeon]
MSNNMWRVQLQDYTAFLKQKYNLNDEQIRQELLSVDIPIEIYNCDNTPLQATIVYFKDYLGYEFWEISNMLAKSIAELKQSYGKANKTPGNIKGTTINSAIFSNKNLSYGELIVKELINMNMSVKDIATSLGKDVQTIHTLKRRASIKLKEVND